MLVMMCNSGAAFIDAGWFFFKAQVVCMYAELRVF